jgi:RHS repeat-associated protein
MTTHSAVDSLLRASPTMPSWYYRARYYDASSGRFNSEDPIRFDDGWANLYLYVTNRPIDLIDRSGLSPQPTMTSPIAPILICPWCNQFLLGSWEMWTNYKRMEEMKWVKGDKYYHCMGNCLATNAGPGGRRTNT